MGTGQENEQFAHAWYICHEPAGHASESGRVVSPEMAVVLAWGKADFRDKMLDKGGVLVSSDKYVYEIDEMAYVTMRCNSPLRNCTAKINGIPVKVYHANGIWTVKHKMEQAGEMRVEFCYGNGKRTHADLLVIDNVKDLVNKRISFIRNRQQMNNPRDLRDGAYMVYDCEADSIYPNNTPNCNPVDRDEGAERVGMGVLLAQAIPLVRQERQ